MSTYEINSQWTLLERAKRSADGKTILPILDVMDKMGVGDLLKDVPYMEANQGLKHRVIRTTNRPASTRRSFYQGVAPNKTTTQVLLEDVVLFEQRSEIDEAHLDTVVNPKEARRQEDEGHIAGLSEDLANSLFNDAKTSGSEYYDGFAARMSTLSYPGHTTTALPYVWDNGGSAGTGYLSSIYVVEWGMKACYGLYPSGVTRAGTYGIRAIDKGKEKVQDASESTKTFYAYVSQFTMWAGLACADDRKVARVANIRQSGESSDNTFDEDILIKLLNHGKFNRSATRIYMNPFIKSDVDIRAKDKGNVNWGSAQVFGEPVTTFLGVPVRTIDDSILTATESAVS